MSDSSNNSMETVSFRRFLSYIYAYEDDTKLRNVGFAKVEVRSQRVRFQVTVNGIFQKGGRPLELCLVDGNLNRIPVGQVILQNGRGEYRGTSNTEDLWDSGMSFSQIYGICLQGAGNRRHYYMTLWREVAKPPIISHNQIVVIPRNREQEKDASQMVHAAEVKEELEEAERPAEKMKLEEVDASAKEMKLEEADIPVKEMRLEKTDASAKEMKLEEEADVSEREMKLEEADVSEREMKLEKADASEKEIKLEEVKLPAEERKPESVEISAEEKHAVESEGDLQDQLDSASELIRQQSAAGIFDTEASDVNASDVNASDANISDENASDGRASGGMNRQSRKRGREDKRMELWKRFCSRYPHVDIRPDIMDDRNVVNGFSEMGKICEVLRIRPNDIGRLPRNNWILAHNSFLQHAYNHSHQLILFRVENQETGDTGDNHWFIGLPGEKSEQETLVAEVFGFKKFLKCKNGGFWYTEIYMGVY